MYIQKNANIPAEPVKGLNISDIFDDLRKKHGAINLAYKFSSHGEIEICPMDIKQISGNSPGFVMVYIPDGNTKCLWVLDKELILPISVFYDFDISLSSVSSPYSYVYDLSISNIFTPIYNSEATVTWSNSGTQQYMGVYLTNWSSLGAFTWNDLTASSFANTYDNLPIINQNVPWQISTDNQGNVFEIIKYTVKSGQLSYVVQFNISGTASAIVISAVTVNIAGQFTAAEEYNSYTFNEGSGPLTGSATGSVNSYSTVLWNSMDTLLAVNMQDSSDILTIYNNGTSPISAYIVTGNNKS